MYKVVLSHTIVPGKYDELVEWCRQSDKQRAEENPGYVPPNRFINQYGVVTLSSVVRSGRDNRGQ